MRKTMKCGRCGTRVRLAVDTVTCTTCGASHHIEVCRAQVMLQAEAHGHVVDEHSFRADFEGFLIFNVEIEDRKPRVADRRKSA